MLDNNKPNDLLNRVASGDEQAFRELYSQFRSRVYNTSMFLLHSETLAEDVLQEVFLKIWTHRSELKNIRNFQAYLNTITRNHIYNVFRKIAGEELLSEKIFTPDSYDNPTALDKLALKELHEALSAAMEHLTPQQRKVFELSKLRGLKNSEIEAELGLNKDTVKKHLSDALRIVRKNLNYNSFAIQLFCGASVTACCVH